MKNIEISSGNHYRKNEFGRIDNEHFGRSKFRISNFIIEKIHLISDPKIRFNNLIIFTVLNDFGNKKTISIDKAIITIDDFKSVISKYGNFKFTGTLEDLNEILDFHKKTADIFY